MSSLRKLVALLKTPKGREQVFRFVRIAGAFIATTGIVDQLANGTATRASIIAAVVGAIEVAYHAKAKA